MSNYYTSQNPLLSCLTTIQFGTHSLLSVPVLILAFVDFLSIATSTIFLTLHRRHPVIIASSLELCFALLFGAMFGVAQMTLVSIPIHFTPHLCRVRFLLGYSCWALILTTGGLKALRIERMRKQAFACGTSSLAVIVQFCTIGFVMV